MRPMRDIFQWYHEQHDRLQMISRSLAISHVAVRKVVNWAQSAEYTLAFRPP
jgi:DNA-binding transcriptional regulator LsrR (DeoR family)